jgi:hypothetical protein
MTTTLASRVAAAGRAGSVAGLAGDAETNTSLWADRLNGSLPYLYDDSDAASILAAVYYELQQHPLFIMRDELLKYITPVLVVFGNFSNLLALIVLRRKSLRQHSVCFYMAAYAFANLLVLNLILGIVWLCYVLELPYVAALADWSCRLWTFVSNVIIYCGIWFVVVLTIDRFIYLCYAHKANTYCTVFAAKAITTMVVIGLVVVSIHAMWTFELQPQGCFVSSEQEDLHTKIWPLWSATVYSYLPLTLLLFINIVLSVSLCLKRHRERRAQTPSGSGVTDDFAISTLVISSAFFLLTMPATVVNVVDIYFPSSWLHVDLIAEIELTKRITEILSSTNQTLLGVILLIFSRAFRQELYAMFHGLRFKRGPNKVYEMEGVQGADCAHSATATATSSTNGNTSTSRNHIEYEACNSCDVTTV